MGQLPDGRLQLWLLEENGAVWSMWEKQTDSQSDWTDWSRFQAVPGARVVHLAVIPLSNGALELFAVDARGRIHSCWKQDAHPNAPWSRWRVFEGVRGKGVVQLAGARLSDNRPQLFAITERGGLYSCWKERAAWDSPWSRWRPFQRPEGMPVRGLACGALADKRMQLWASTPLRGDQYAIWTCRKRSTDPASPWTRWVRMPFPIRAMEEPREVVQEEPRTGWSEEEGAAHPA